jgi:hypothetical protein
VEETVMINRVALMGVAVFAGALVACSSGDPSGRGELAVQGSVSQAVSLDNARVIAIGSDGRTFWSYLDAQRDFTLFVPVGQSYRVVIASEQAGGLQVKAGHLVVQAASGATSWLGANQPGLVDLGVLQLTTQRDARDRREPDHSDDNECHEGTHQGYGGGGWAGHGFCDGGHDEPLQPTKTPGAWCDDHDHHHGDAGKDDDGDWDDEPCQGDGGAHDGGANDSGAHGGDAGTTSGGDSGSSTGGGVGADCLTSAQCATGLVCVAGLCTAG